MISRRVLIFLTAAGALFAGELPSELMPSAAERTAALQVALVRVVDQYGTPIPYAQAWVNGRPPVTADTLGEVRLPKPLEAGTRVMARRIGYAPGDTTLTSLLPEALLVTLQPTGKQLEEVRTIAERSTPLSRTGFYDRMSRVRNGAINGEFVTPEELDSRATGMLSQVFQGRMLVRVGGNPYRPKLTGRAGCAIDILADGKVINGPLDEYVSASEIMGVEIYGSTANAPAELIPTTRRGSCGLIAIWTGPRR